MQHFFNTLPSSEEDETNQISMTASHATGMKRDISYETFITDDKRSKRLKTSIDVSLWVKTSHTLLQEVWKQYLESHTVEMRDALNKILNSIDEYQISNEEMTEEWYDLLKEASDICDHLAIADKADDISVSLQHADALLTRYEIDSSSLKFNEAKIITHTLST